MWPIKKINEEFELVDCGLSGKLKKKLSLNDCNLTRKIKKENAFDGLKIQ